MKTRQKKLFRSLLLSALPAVGLTAGSFVTVSADPIIIEPMAPTTSEPVRTSIDGDKPVEPTDPKDYPQGLLFPYSLLDDAYKSNIDLNGNVAYANLKDNKSLNAYLRAAAVADLTQFPVFDVYEVNEETGRRTKVSKNRTAELVFWLNTYNALVLSSIAQAYPIKSVDLIKNFDSEKKHRVAGKDYSFKELREKIIGFDDPRVLFAMTTGTAGGFLPAPTAIRHIELNARLDAAASVFVNDQRNVTLTRIQNVAVVSPMFKEIDSAFAKSRRNKWDGIRRVLATYTQQRGNRSYFTTNDYRIDFGNTNRNVNDSFNSATMAPVQTLK